MSNIEDIGEFGLIELIKNHMDSTIEGLNGVVGIGDDCAVIPLDENRELLVTIDTLVCNRHFYEGTDPFLLGRKALAVNISDVAAMAGDPKYCFLSLTLNNSVSVEYVNRFVEGFVGLASEFSIVLLGGDTVGGDEFSITVALIGENERGLSIRRSGALVGDDVYVTGRIGCSYAGLEAIKRGLDGYEELKKAHLDPIPRLKEARMLRGVASAMIDVSDGLVQDCEHICASSGVGMELFMEEIPFCDTDLVDEKSMIAGGEDYELVFCVRSKYKGKLSVMENIKKIGKVVEGRGVRVVSQSRTLNIEHRGYKHF